MISQTGGTPGIYPGLYDTACHVSPYPHNHALSLARIIFSQGADTGSDLNWLPDTCARVSGVNEWVKKVKARVTLNDGFLDWMVIGGKIRWTEELIFG